MFHVKHLYLVITEIKIKMFHVKHEIKRLKVILLRRFIPYISTKLFLIANTAACVLSATSIFLKILEI